MVILRRGPPNEGVECKGSMKNSEFPPISRVISETIQDRAVVTMEDKYKTASTLSSGTSFNDLE